MNFKEIERRLVQLEREAAAKERAWVQSLSDAELDELCKDTPPEEQEAIVAMSDEDLDRLDNDLMSEAEWEEHIQRARERLGLGPVI